MAYYEDDSANLKREVELLHKGMKKQRDAYMLEIEVSKELLRKKEFEIALYKKELNLCYVELNKLEHLRKD